MKIKAAAPALPDELKRLLLHGPRPGQSLPTPEQHDEMVRLWERHEVELRQACRHPWFVARMRFVADIRAALRYRRP